MAASHANPPAVKDLATKMQAAQGPEIDTMTGWLKAWGKDSTAGSSGMDGMGGMTQGSGAMPGMMGDGQMKSLDAANGAAFDQMFLALVMSPWRRRDGEDRAGRRQERRRGRGGQEDRG